MTSGHAPHLEIAEHAATITLRRPGQHNRIDPDDPAAIMDHIATIRATPSVRLLVLTAEGERTFCSGYTLGQIGTRLDRSLEDMLDAIESLEIPTLCALNGSAYGGGTDLALACDFRIGVRGCRLFMPAARFGLHYYPGGLRRFVTRLGCSAAKKIFLTGMTLESEELLRTGFLTELVEREALLTRVAEYRDSIALCEAQAVRSMKAHINAISAGEWDEASGRAAYEASLRSRETERRLAELAAR
ncbi:MAG TPA: enoyl-CoA hydratase/isomerase family protein [Ramlibacter sp.]|uniref:enoyl-CoA hydratase/isomerase family protein n=1 Tax=Ramlibacter sp. TaxID=1917967 RepID=UPI002C181DE6|nr:enoyl-CoA hydratase/isomerase family protein [Ramlibacter sp.]HVZ45647.1 enoyl-CoA hydratase/isomerase family protein [Ramlibacter sp.]